MLGDGDTFLYGALGALLALFVVQVLPTAFELAAGRAKLELSLSRVVGALLVMAIFVAGGGVAAFLVGDAQEAKHAVAYGLGWQGTLGGFIQSQR